MTSQVFTFCNERLAFWCIMQLKISSVCLSIYQILTDTKGLSFVEKKMVLTIFTQFCTLFVENASNNS